MDIDMDVTDLESEDAAIQEVDITTPKIDINLIVGEKYCTVSWNGFMQTKELVEFAQESVLGEPVNIIARNSYPVDQNHVDEINDAFEERENLPNDPNERAIHLLNHRMSLDKFVKLQDKVDYSDHKEVMILANYLDPSVPKFGYRKNQNEQLVVYNGDIKEELFERFFNKFTPSVLTDQETNSLLDTVRNQI